MHYLVILMTFITLILFWGCIKTYSVNGKILVEGMGFASIEFYWWVILAINFAIFITIKNVGKWMLLIFYLIWLIALFMNHWKPCFFGATEKKITGYNNSFKNTIRILPTSEKRVIPDLYHIILSLAVILDLLVLVFFY